jgi:tetratricopeptide (TPR) repeat protein
MMQENLIARAIALQESGALADARRLYESILRLEPDHAEAQHQLGVLLLQSGEAEKALALIQAAAKSDPDSAIVASDLATALHALGRTAPAIGAYEKALALDPNLAEAHYGLGSILFSQSRLDEALASLQKAAMIDPDYAEAHHLIGAALRQALRPAQAIVHYRRALDIDPDYALARADLAGALREARKLTEAAVEYQKAIALDPLSADAYNGLGLVQDAQNLPHEALASFDRALALRPDDAEIHTNRGLVLQVLGEIAVARAEFERACQLEPATPRHFFALANSSAEPVAEDHVQRMLDMSRNADDLPVEDKIRLHFALHKALSDKGAPDEGFEHLLKANALKRMELAYDERQTLGLLDRIRDVFTQEFIDRRANCGEPSGTPIFIVGMPRSGSTLVEQILASSPLVFSAGERGDLRDCIQIVCGEKAPGEFPECVPKLSNGRLHTLGGLYVERMGGLAQASRPAATRISDKTLMHFALLGLIRIVLPNSHVIHVHRNPVDACLSCYSKLFDDDLPFTYELGELGRYYRAYEKMMEYWSMVLPSPWILDVQYEELVQDFEQQARRIMSHCNLPWDEACLAFHETKRAVRTASSSQVRQPLYRTSINKRRPKENLLAPLLAGLELPKPPAAENVEQSR